MQVSEEEGSHANNFETKIYKEELGNRINLFMHYIFSMLYFQFLKFNLANPYVNKYDNIHKSEALKL